MSLSREERDLAPAEGAGSTKVESVAAVDDRDAFEGSLGRVGTLQNVCTRGGGTMPVCGRLRDDLLDR